MNELILTSVLGSTSVHVGDASRLLESTTTAERTIFITDHNIFRLYRGLFSGAEPIVIGTGEEQKNLETVESIYDRLLEMEVDRSSLITGVGGGIVCDITGFAASTFLRGLRFQLVPTSLLSQVDSSIGGKTGVNHRGYKNQIGTFSQPESIILDFGFMRTLPSEEVWNGAAEVFKHAIIADAALFSYLERDWRRLIALEPDAVRRAVTDSIRIKAAVVEKDARESGMRRILNFGHTLGHALEYSLGIPHGRAVGFGMAMAVEISAEEGMLPEDERLRIRRLLDVLDAGAAKQMDPERLIEAVSRDKKRQADTIHFVLLEGIGKPRVHPMTYRKLEGYIHDLCESF